MPIRFSHPSACRPPERFRSGALAAYLRSRRSSSYKVVDHWKIGGSGSWDYSLADPSAHLVYVTHGPRVEVIDTKTQ